MNLATEKLDSFSPKEGFASEQVLEAVKEAGLPSGREQKQSDYAKQVAEERKCTSYTPDLVCGATVPLLIYFNGGVCDWFAVSFGSHGASPLAFVSAQLFLTFTGYLVGWGFYVRGFLNL